MIQQTITASHSVTVQYLSQLPALNTNYVNLMVITYWCRQKNKFDLLVPYYRIHKRTLLSYEYCFLTNFTELELTNVQANYWRRQMHCGPQPKFWWGHGTNGPTTVTPWLLDFWWMASDEDGKCYRWYLPDAAHGITALQLLSKTSKARHAYVNTGPVNSCYFSNVQILRLSNDWLLMQF